MSTVIIIPARYDSSRFPGKPLVDILGKSMLQRVWEKCKRVPGEVDVYVATDDERIKSHCIEHNMSYIMTSKECITGTDRVAEAYKLLKREYTTIVNVQGDEPLIRSEDISIIINHHKYDSIVLCGYCDINNEEDFSNPNIIKVVLDGQRNLLYASRAGIPINKQGHYQVSYGYRQVCIYAFSPYYILRCFDNKKTPYESVEDIEILRLIEKGHRVAMVKVSRDSISVDIPEDVERVKRRL